MKKMLSVAAVALFVAGSSALACGGGGCSAKKADAKKPACCQTKEAKGEKACCAKKEAKKCGADCTKPCCAKKADAKK